MSRPRRLIVGAATAGLLSTRALLAAPCGRGDLLDAFPPDQAVDVPVDATLSAHYGNAAEYLGEPVSFGTEGAAVAVEASFDASEGVLSVTPGGPLAPNTAYEIDWPGLRGLNSAAVGSAFNVHFTTGAGPDSAAPAFDGLTGIEFDVHHARDECTDSVEDRYRFRLSLAKATDDGGTDALALLVFQTSGPNIPEGSPEPILLRPFPDSLSVNVDRAVPDAVGRICFAAIAKDLTGKVSSSGDREVCTRTAEPPVFFGCCTGGPARGTAGYIALALAALFWVRTRRGGHAP